MIYKLKYTYSIFLLTLLSFAGRAENNGISFIPYGYLSYEIIYDTYRSLDTRDGELYLFPKKPVFDVNGNDINQRSKFNMITVQSRVGFNIMGPEILGARSSGRLEGDFYGTSQANVRMMRLRQAFINLQWESTQLLMGNTFHPTFVLDCFPNTVSFAAAVPFHPLNRSPQLRIRQELTSTISASASFLVHGYHSSAGPNDAQRNSGLPESVVQVRYNSSSVLMGVTAGYKFLSPRDTTLAGVATHKRVGAYSLQAFTKISTRPVTLKLEGLLGENMSHFVMIGGYGAKGTEETIDWNSDYDYANLRTVSVWGDLESNNPVWQWAIFAGYTENLGSADPYLPIAGLSRYDDLHYLLRVSPRIFYHTGNLSLGAEYAWYNAVYAEAFDEYRKPTVSMDAAVNHHITLQARYNF